MTEATKVARKRRYVELADRPDKRALLLDAAEQIIQEEGYAAATARNIAARIGLKHQVVFYYFDSYDDLLLELYRKVSDNYSRRLSSALESDHPLTAMWEVVSDRRSTRFALEFMALANHNGTIREALADSSHDFRRLEAQALARYFKKQGRDAPLDPELIVILVHAVARLYVQEATVGIHTGHDGLEKFVSGVLATLQTDSNPAEHLRSLKNVGLKL